MHIMKAIVLAFTLKDQDFEKIKFQISKIKERVGKDVILIHGFMPAEVARQKGFPTHVSNCLNKHFPVQLNMYNKGTLRTQMAVIASKLDADVYVIGNVTGGVSEEVNLYREFNRNIRYFSL
jgi:hypothetical protein